MENKLSIRYIVELVITVLLLLFIAVVLVRMFVHSRGETIYAGNLTEAVKISESLAELSAGTDDKQEFIDMVSGLESVIAVTEEGDEIAVKMHGMDKDSDGTDYLVKIRWQEEEKEYGTFRLQDMDVYADGGTEAIYSLSTGDYEGN